MRCFWHLPNRDWIRLGMMIFGGLLIFAAILVKGSLQNEFPYNESDILEDSEVGYVLKTAGPSGTVIGEGGRLMPDRYKFEAVARKGKCYGAQGEIWHGRFVEKKRKKIPSNKYIELWKSLKSLGIWSKESKTAEILYERIKGKNPEEAEKLYLEMYEYLELEQDTLFFTIRVKNLEHKFEVYDIEGLRDKTYLKIREEIDTLVTGAKTIKIWR
jgi:hypothetical protein